MSPTARSPFASLPAQSRPALAWLGVAAVVKAFALILVAEGLARGLTAIIDGSDAWRGPVAIGAAGVILRALVEWAMQVIARRAALGVKEDVRLQVAKRVLARGGRDLDARAGGLTALATGSLDELDGYFTGYLPALVSAATIPLIVGARILLADWVSAVIILLTVPLIPVFMILIGHYTEDRVEQSLDAITRLSDHLVELARGLPVLVGLGRAQEQTAALRDIADGVRRRTLETLRVAFLSSLALELIATLSVAIVAVFIGVRLVNGSLSLETGLLALILAPECYLPLRQVGMAHHASEDGIEALTRLRRLIDTPVSEPAWSAQPDDVDGPAFVQVEGLTVRYAGRPEPVVADLSFTVAPGETVALAGPSGAGKSTVIAALAGLLGTSADGTSVTGTITGVDPERQAWVPQHPETFAATVLDEIVLALAGDSVDEAMALLERTGAATFAHRDPAELSQGELRRVALARALARVERGATLLLLDEPTAHLDPVTAAILHDVIRSLKGRVTIILVAHDAATRVLADREIVVNGAPSVPEHPAGVLAMDVDHDEEQHVHPAAAEVAPGTGIWRALVRLIQPTRRPFVLAVAMGVAAALAAVALSALSGWLIVRASQQPPILMLMVAIVGVRFFGIGRALFRYLQRLWLHDAILGSLRDVRMTVWEAIARVGPSAKRLLRGDQALDRLIGDVDRLRDLAPRVLVPPLIGILAALAATVALWIILPVAGMVLLVATLLSTIVAPAVALLADHSARVATVEMRSGVLRAFASLVGAAADLRVNGMDEGVLARLEEMDAHASDLERRSAWSLGMASGIVTLSNGLAAMGMIVVGADAVAAEHLSHPLLAVIALTPLALVDPLHESVEAIQRWPALRAVVARFAPLLDAPLPAPDTVVASGPPTARIDRISLEKMSARWPGMPGEVFSGVTFTALRGDRVVITGPSGAGKSTLLSVLMGFLRPSSGTYAIDGVDTAKMPLSALRRHISWCPQEAHLFDSTLRGNLLLARPREDALTDDEMRVVLDEVGLGDLLAGLPDGLDTRIGSRGSRLSGGQRQRLAIARALLTRADVVLLDEPTAHLDRPSADALMADLRQILRDRIVVIVTHHAAELLPADIHVRLR